MTFSRINKEKYLFMYYINGMNYPEAKPSGYQNSLVCALNNSWYSFSIPWLLTPQQRKLSRLKQRKPELQSVILFPFFAYNKLMKKLDHRYLNELPEFSKLNPTTENIARYVFRELSGEINNIKKVTVWESEKSCASYSPQASRH